jgi:flavorubredoxin
MPKVLVVYATRAGETQNIADYIAEGIRFAGCDAKIVNVNTIKAAEDFAGYDAYVLGSATYHGEMLSSMKTLLFMGEKAGLEGKAGGAFGAFGWSGEAPDRIFDTMKHIFKMDMVSGPLRLKSSNLGGGVKAAQDYGREIGKKITT